jgi:ribonuclease Z
MLRYNIRPLAKKGVNVDDVPEPLDLNKVQTDLRQQKPEVIKLAEEAASLIPSVLSNNNEGDYGIIPPEVAAVVNNATTSSSLPINDIKLTFLGTGAAVPSKYRNVTSLFADLGAEKGTMMMDCGEGSYSQLCRRFGKHQADEYLKALRCIWISHIHADHHVGLPTLLSTRCKLLGAGAPPLLVVGPRPLRRALHAYGQVEPLNAQFVDSIYTTAEFGGDYTNGANGNADGMNSTGPRPPPPPPAGALEAINQVKTSLDLSRLESIRVIHCAHSYGLILESSQQPRWKLVLSGDTRPCPALNQAAQGATVFIHEATFEDGLDEEADAKKHCCVKDALHAGVVSGAYRTILTHFSQRYPKIPVLNEDNLKNQKIGLAYDMMTVGLGDLPRLPCVIPALQGLCGEEDDDDDEEGEGEDGR